ncbi:hypothetical protein [Actinomadura mexicana]|uniref:N-acetyltransferase domain-containing protein n=1 Tax=Actinomadura mexicana TaxID=134959 RepID=A0A238W8Z0_9ACTN|nr:hypothetical protein [Actinomadura mexicana]SNR42861.1 hypothetical protein SAMN06265355_102827 [Actinomadura mexicana]
MLLMLPADSARHRDGVRAMVTARVAWLRRRGLSAPEGIAETLAGQVGEPEWPVWALEADGTVVGCTTVLSECPAWAFTQHERQQPSVFLASTWTLPSANRFGHSIARWALDHAARTGRLHVRRGAFHTALADYYCRVQGWTLLREVERRGRTGYIMSRPAERQPDLPVRTATAPTATAAGG